MESKNEFETSFKDLMLYIHEKKEVIGDGFYQLVKNLIDSITKSIEDVGNHYFMHRTTFGFLGSSIIEASNTTIKNRDNKCLPNMTIDTSSMKQLQQVEDRISIQNQKIAKEINETDFYTNSLTSPYLTRYMEGVMAKNFDRRLDYSTCYTGNNEWKVISTEHTNHVNELLSITNDNETKKKDTSGVLRFVRVRTVCVVKSKFLTCSCGYVQRYLAPCSHIMAVLHDRQYVQPSLFHVRWLKLSTTTLQTNFVKKRLWT